ncbi:lysylphosphatidylglycerol synthase domain-containing protein [Humitalea sp. 24SJ18S-53]|uniref:lysylphosphatidylglycerol synthase domain-containing protein n=1 Tax=Humitalea sp. 24SJ18S-53 TaxID=3422307 RepID=UPI003D6672AE
MSVNWPSIRRHGTTVFGLALLVGAIFVVQREFRSLKVSDITAALEAIPNHTLWVAAGWTVLAYAVLTIYDRLGSVYAGKPVSYSRTSLASFCAYTLAHNIGFAAVSGAAVRYRFYAAWGLTPVEIAKVIAFTSLTFGLGGFALGGLVLVLEPEVVPYLGTNLPHWAMQSVGVAMWCIVAAYLLLSRVKPHFIAFGHQIDLPGFRMALFQTLLASVDVAVTAMIFYALLPPAEGLTFIRFLGIYVASYTGGLVASIPGGIGVFDGAILLGLSPYLPTAEVVGALLLFRLYYYIIPLFLAGGLFIAFELGQRRTLLARIGPMARITESFEVPVLAGLTGLGGLILLFIGALPVKGTLMEAWAGHIAAGASHFASSLLGSLLLVAAYGLVRRLRLAWGVGLFLLLSGAFAIWLRGEAWWLWGAFIFVAALLAATRRGFYRDAGVLAEPVSPGSAAALAAGAACAVTLALVAYGGPVREESWWQVVMAEDAPDSLRFTVGLCAVMLLYAALRLLRPARITPVPWDDEARARFAALGGKPPTGADAALFLDNGRGALAFVKRHDVWIAIGDPVGDATAVIWRFRDLCERNAVDPAFFDVREADLRIYGDLGLVPVAIEERPGRFLVARAETAVRVAAAVG